MNIPSLSACCALLLAAATCPALAAPATRQSAEEPKGSFSFTRDFAQAKTYGQGPHRYRMILRHPQNGTPLANQDYALSHSSVDLSFVAEPKKVFQGTTDAQGRTAVFAFGKPVPAAGWNLRPRTGSGPLGEQMVVRDDEGPMKDFHYALLVCEGDTPYIYRGITDASGQTAYVATVKPANITLYADGDQPMGSNACTEE
ncbi:hypothetical protein [Neisseria shayeganii]|uniref:Secreted protein n=1 Tax=Neisseria shayeganii 871 TaxID=1032488 RepID=G4CHR1_9NEIS|nr:hypothetical protein [Neisseria shayeganii]EGY52640.1 hypothetical protein HMPREF9371_1150 [Neisseria shayeganii 871]